MHQVDHRDTGCAHVQDRLHLPHIGTLETEIGIQDKHDTDALKRILTDCSDPSRYPERNHPAPLFAAPGAL